jgi:hypothetical protein
MSATPPGKTENKQRATGTKLLGVALVLLEFLIVVVIAV